VLLNGFEATNANEMAKHLFLLGGQCRHSTAVADGVPVDVGLPAAIAEAFTAADPPCAKAVAPCVSVSASHAASLSTSGGMGNPSADSTLRRYSIAVANWRTPRVDSARRDNTPVTTRRNGLRERRDNQYSASFSTEAGGDNADEGGQGEREAVPKEG
jgi:hypothetical protein